MNKEKALNKLLKYFIDENKEVAVRDMPSDYIEKRKLLRALMNIRGPEPVDSEILKLQNELIKEETLEKIPVDPYMLPTVADGFSGTQIPFSEKLVLCRVILLLSVLMP